MRYAIWTVAGICILVLAVGAGFLWGDKHALDSVTIAQVTPDQLVRAMGSDDFFGLWRESTLVVSGTIAGVTQQNGDTLIQLKTDSVSNAYCNIGNATTSLATGDPVKVVADGEVAERIPQGVMLVRCQLL